MGVYLRMGDAYERVAAIVSTGININGEPIDVTDSDGSRWRQIIAGGVTECTTSGSGFITDRETHDELERLATTGESAEFLLRLLDGTDLEFPMQVINFELAGEYQGAQTYNLTLASADALTAELTAEVGWDPDSYSLSFGSGSAQLTVVRSGNTGAMAVSWITTIGTTGTVSWPLGDASSRTVTLDVADETITATTFTVTLSLVSGPSNTVVSPSVATVSLATLTLTSRLYPIWAIESIALDTATMGNIHSLSWPPEGLDLANASITAIALSTDLVTYGYGAPEGLDLANAELTGIALESLLIIYTDWPPEGIDLANASMTAIAMDVILITYADWPAEGLQLENATITGIALT